MEQAGQRLGAVIVAAGRSTRMSGLDKQFALLGDRPVLSHSLRVFAGHSEVSAIVVVAAPEHVATVTRLAEMEAGSKLAAVVAGGERRQDSVRRGIEVLADCTAYAIHDGARPLVTEEIITRGLDSLARMSAAIAVMPVVDTMKQVNQWGLVVDTLARDQLRAAQTPQFFRREVLAAVYATVDWEREYTDEAGLVEAAGGVVGTFAGAADNIKITTPGDLVIASALWRLRQEQSA